MIVATTPRLILRHWEEADAGAADHIYSDPETMRLFGSGAPFTSAEIAASFPALIDEYRTFGYGNYAVIERATGAILGHCGARFIVARNRVEADWALHRSVWGMGYGTEAARAVFLRSFSIDEVSDITGVAHRENLASIALMKRLGMHHVHDEEICSVPLAVYSISRASFRLQREIEDEIQLQAV